MPVTPIIMKGHERPITQVKYNYDGDLIFSSSKDKLTTCWRSDTGTRIGTYQTTDRHAGAVNTLDIDRKTERLATGGSDSAVRIWNAQDGDELFKFTVDSSVRSVSFALGDRQLLAAQDSQYGSTPKVFVYHLCTQNGTEAKWDPIAEPRETIEIPEDKHNIVTAMWADLNKSIITGRENGILRRWDVESGTLLDEINVGRGLTSMQYSKDGTMFITASKLDQCAKLIDTKTLKVIRTYQSNRPINSGAISPLFNQVLIGGGTEAKDVALVSGRMSHFEVDFWHACFQEYMGSAKGHFGPVNSIDIHPNGKSFVSGGEEGEIRLHHLDEAYLKSSKKMNLEMDSKGKAS